MNIDDAEIRTMIDRERARSFGALNGVVSVLGGIRSDDVRKVGESFKIAMNRVFLLQGLPSAMQRYGQFEMEGALQIASRVFEYTALHRSAPSEEDAARINKEVQEHLQSELGFDPNVIKDRDVADYRVLLQMSAHPAVAMGYDAHRAAVLIQGWMCFEVLCGDLWTPAVNASPNVLGRNVNAALPKDEKMNWDDVARARFDLRHKIGSVFARRISFQSLEKIRRAFQWAFADDYKPLLKDIFDDPALIRVEKCRHLLVHRGGRVDSAFAQAAENDRLWGKVAVGDELKISESIATDSWTAAANAGSNLLSAVNSWLMAHVESPRPEVEADFEI
jgi:hypothetical protein